MEYTVYIIKSETTQGFYIGQTQNIEQRIEYHNTGRSKYTKNLGPWRLFASKIFDTRAESISWERKLKNLKSRSSIENFIHKHKFNQH